MLYIFNVRSEIVKKIVEDTPQHVSCKVAKLSRIMKESLTEKLTNKLNVFCFLVERLKAGDTAEELEKVIDMSYESIEDVRQLLFEVELKNNKKT